MALSSNPGEVIMDTTSVDIQATKECLLHLSDAIPNLQCQESGSTLRFLLPIAMTQKNKVIFTGSGRLPTRPLSPLKEEMESHGCHFSKTTGNSQEIFTVEGRLTCGNFILPGNISSQYITGLLFALPLLCGDSQISITSPLESSAYVDLTLEVIRSFGVKICVTEKNSLLTFHIFGRQEYVSPGAVKAEGDWSNSAFWIIGGIIEKNSAITLTQLDSNSSQGDSKILSLAKAMGGVIKSSNHEICALPRKLRGIEIDGSGIPDLIPILAVAASVSEGQTRIYNAARLRIKESDRLASMTECLKALGGKIEELEDGLIIQGVPYLTGGIVDSHNDHRIVMAMAIAASCASEPITIKGAEAVNKSYPDFFKDFSRLGGKINVI